MSLLTCRHLSVSYDGKAVLSDLNFSVDEGDYYRIVASEYTVIRAGMFFRAAFINIFRTDDNAAVSFESPPF